MFMDCGRKPEYLERTHMQTPCRKTPDWGSNPGPSFYEATVLPAAPPHSPHWKQNLLFYWVGSRSRCFGSFVIAVTTGLFLDSYLQIYPNISVVQNKSIMRAVKMFAIWIFD
ncbi:hypothetical protein ILYODFUR_035267 [Ilyodon furcidens]|uniref:Uncharacterized protein n=1 Tax=Ilyodon furcidens TaxID=33524 RepID=A0ABV0SS48_9TELE